MAVGKTEGTCVERLEALNGISRSLLDAPGLRDCYTILREGTARFVTFDAFAIGVFHPDGARLRLRYLFETDVEHPRVTRSPIPELYKRLIERPEPFALQTRQAILDASGNDLWRIGDPSPLAQTAFFAPVFIDERVLGFMTVQSYVPNAFAVEDQAALTALAHAAAFAERSFLWRSRFQHAQVAGRPDAESSRAPEPRPAPTGPLDAIVPATSLRDRAMTVFEALIDAVDDKDSYSRNHAALVSQAALAAAETLRLPDRMHRTLYTAAMLLDVGKIGIPDTVLLKPGKLTDAEMELVRQHTIVGSKIAGQMSSLVGDPEMLDAVRGAIRSHHERWDGAGYPDGLAGISIPYLARLLAIADSYAAMLVDRPYKAALTAAEAQAELRAGAGSRYDPTMVEAFVAAQQRAAEAWIRLGAD